MARQRPEHLADDSSGDDGSRTGRHRLNLQSLTSAMHVSLIIGSLMFAIKWRRMA